MYPAVKMYIRESLGLKDVKDEAKKTPKLRVEGLLKHGCLNRDEGIEGKSTTKTLPRQTLKRPALSGLKHAGAL